MSGYNAVNTPYGLSPSQTIGVHLAQCDKDGTLQPLGWVRLPADNETIERLGSLDAFQTDLDVPEWADACGLSVHNGIRTNLEDLNLLGRVWHKFGDDRLVDAIRTYVLHVARPHSVVEMCNLVLAASKIDYHGYARAGENRLACYGQTVLNELAPTVAMELAHVGLERHFDFERLGREKVAETRDLLGRDGFIKGSSKRINLRRLDREELVSVAEEQPSYGVAEPIR